MFFPEDVDFTTFLNDVLVIFTMIVNDLLLIFTTILNDLLLIFSTISLFVLSDAKTPGVAIAHAGIWFAVNDVHVVQVDLRCRKLAKSAHVFPIIRYGCERTQ